MISEIVTRASSVISLCLLTGSVMQERSIGFSYTALPDSSKGPRLTYSHVAVSVAW